MADDWMRKYLVIAGQAPMTAELPKQEKPIVIPPAEEPVAVAEIKPKKPVRKRPHKSDFNEAAAHSEPAPKEDKPKKTLRKPGVKKEFNDAVEMKPRKSAPKSKPARRVRI
jgi:hypothetical protein